MRRKILVFLFVLFCLIPLTGCPPKKGIFYGIYAPIDNDNSLYNNRVYLFVGNDAKNWTGKYEENKIIDESLNLYENRDFVIGMKIDGNEDYYVKYTIKDDDIFSSKYDYLGGEIILDQFTEDGTFKFDIADVDIKNSFTIEFSYTKKYSRLEYSHVFEGHFKEDKFIVTGITRYKNSIKDERFDLIDVKTGRNDLL